MRYTTTRTEEYAGIADFLATKFYAGEIEPDDWHHGDGYFFGRFGRRILIDEYGMGSPDYERYDTFEQAYRRMEELHDQRPPAQDSDAIVYEDRHGYGVSIEGIHVGTFATRDEAVRAVAEWMVDAGCFPDAFETNDRGWWTRIDAEVRGLHDEGGDKMRPDLQAAQ